MPNFELLADLTEVVADDEKFWAVTQDGASVTERFGKLGTDGQIKVKVLTSAAEAEAEVAKLIKEKTKEGYIDTFEYNEEDRNDPSFIGIFCAECDNEIGYDPCPNCEE